MAILSFLPACGHLGWKGEVYQDVEYSGQSIYSLLPKHPSKNLVHVGRVAGEVEEGGDFGV